MNASLTIFIKTGESQTVRFPRTGVCNIGRSDDNSVVIDDPSISPHHVQFAERDGTWWVRDLGSVYGTLLNWKRVSESKLSDGDSLLIGSIRCKFEVLDDFGLRPDLEAITPDSDSGQEIKPETPETATPSSPALAEGLRGMGTHALAGLGSAVDPAKIVFFLLGGVAIVMVVYLFVTLATQYAHNLTTAGLLLLLGIAFGVGLAGVVAGGLAFMTREEAASRKVGVRKAIHFVRQRFRGLFLSTLALFALVFIGFALVNGPIHLLANKPGLSREVAGLLFPFQFLANALLAAMEFIGVLVVCAAGLDEMRPLPAVLQVLTIARQRARGLVAHIACTLFFAQLLAFASLLVACCALAPTMISNGPSMLGCPLPFAALTDCAAVCSQGTDPSKFAAWAKSNQGKSSEQAQTELAGNQESKPQKSFVSDSGKTSGDILRYLSLVLIMAVALSVPVIYWICSFTHYYISMPAPGRRDHEAV